ncbi:MAG: iron chaperone [Mycobacteriales bacterium]
MPASEIDAYLADVEEPKRSTLEEVRRRILEVIPDAEQTISYKCPAFKVDGKVIAGFAAFTKHLSYLPHSGSVLGAVTDAAKYGGTKSALHFGVDEPLPRELIKQLVEARLRQAGM